MKKYTQKSDDSELHWFWKLTTKWWFFPDLYLGLALLLAFIWELEYYWKSEESLSFYNLYLLAIIFMPGGLLYFLEKIVFYESFIWELLYIFYPMAIASYFIILFYKYKRNRILKWLILTLLILLILSFFGCAMLGPPPTHF